MSISVDDLIIIQDTPATAKIDSVPEARLGFLNRSIIVRNGLEPLTE